ncbi:MAG: adenine phosphoribosyltransferase [Clostridiales Family XIII bacterium]|jgi:adenine phosphoribosyltransferase|nr:adenine phosphoribosyltransferase [Clostridiales Family XIII bacterium]
MNEYEVRLGEGFSVRLPLVKVDDELSIYSFNMMGKADWNRTAAESLAGIIQPLCDGSADGMFDVVLTAESKAIGLTDQLARRLGIDRYVVLRKSVKAYMKNPIGVDTQSITTGGTQRLYLDESDFELLQGKRALVVDDVVSTGGTLDAIFRMAEKAGFKITLIACVLTEGIKRSEYGQVRMISLDHIPLP